MLIFPAIDIQAGRVVRLFQGKFKEKTVYSSDPVKTAQHWIRQGAKALHVVDLDGAEKGAPQNLGMIKKICAVSSAPVQCGGGARSAASIEALFDSGAWRVVLGTRAAQDKQFLKKAFRKFKDRIIVSIDAREGKVRVEGWEKSAGVKAALGFAVELKEIGFKQAIYTDISKDGTLQGPSIKQLKELLKSSGLEIIASGGVSSLEDMHKLKALEKSGVTGVIIGKALYEGRFTLAQALKLAK